jgi:hypothetical protein
MLTEHGSTSGGSKPHECSAPPHLRHPQQVRPLHAAADHQPVARLKDVEGLGVVLKGRSRGLVG